MQFVMRHPDRAYIDTHLWLPQMHMGNYEHIRSTLTFGGQQRDLVEAWDATPHHVRVPRNYLPAGSLARLPFPVVDARVRQFPYVNLQSSVILDFQDPTKTFQAESSAALLSTYDGILSLRCGAGKSPTALHAGAQLHVPILIVVNENGLAEQWATEIKLFLGLSDADIGRVGEGKFDWENKPITVAVVHSLAARALAGTLPVEMTRYFGLIICDEAHIMGAPYFNAAIPPFHGRRWGLSATPVREDDFDPLLRYTFGDVVFSYLMPELTLEVIFKKIDTKLNMKDPDERDAVNSKLDELHLLKLYGHLARSRPERTALIAADIADAMSKGRQVLVLTHSKDMCDELAIYFDNAGVCNSDVKGKERIRRIRECNPVIAIMQCGKQALNKKSLDTLFLLEPTRKSGVLQQITGRILRIDPNKKSPIFLIYEDTYIREMANMCGRIRKSFNRWPANKGGRISYRVIGP